MNRNDQNFISYYFCSLSVAYRSIYLVKIRSIW
jgi:hypothetical protein